MSNNAKTMYNMRHYEQIHLWIPVGQKAVIEKAAKQRGESINRYVALAVEAALKADEVKFSKIRLDKYEKIG